MPETNPRLPASRQDGRRTLWNTEMSWLSPVSWAKWTWTAVRGGEGEEEDEDGQEASERREYSVQRDREEEEEEERSQECRQVSFEPRDFRQCDLHCLEWRKMSFLHVRGI